ncbi:hypothetical protein NMY22_g5223 [Coprinellus aureogranulatus]|nr:hypothetical protein NMY22_g5223 [Coprinellus aureogranulatus]
MTTLRSFQHEIEEIHNREVTRQRATTATISEKDKDKENAKVMKGKVKVGAESTTTKKEQPDVETDALPVGSTDEDDDQILNLLLSKEPADHDAVRDRIAALLTRHNGEYVIRIGEQPPRLAPDHQSPLPSAIVAHFLRQVQHHHCRTPSQSPLPLHFDANTQSLVEYPWPVNPETNERVPPSMLESFRRSNNFRGPCCLCALLDGKPYSETLIGIVEVPSSSTYGHHSYDDALYGQYVAVCSRQRCGYSLWIEKFFPLKGLKVQPCLKRCECRTKRLSDLVYNLFGYSGTFGSPTTYAYFGPERVPWNQSAQRAATGLGQLRPSGTQPTHRS